MSTSFARITALILACCALLVSARSKTYTVGYDKLPIDPINATIAGKPFIGSPPTPFFGLRYRNFYLQATTAQVAGLQPYTPPSTLIINLLGTATEKETGAPPLMSVNKGSFTLHSFWMGCELDLFPVKIPVDCAVTAKVTKTDNTVARHRMTWKASNKMAFYKLPPKVFENAKNIEWFYIEKLGDVAIQPQWDDVHYTVYT